MVVIATNHNRSVWFPACNAIQTFGDEVVVLVRYEHKNISSTLRTMIRSYPIPGPSSLSTERAIYACMRKEPRNLGFEFEEKKLKPRLDTPD